MNYYLNLLRQNCPNIRPPRCTASKPKRQPAPTAHFVPWFKAQEYRGGPIGLAARYILNIPNLDEKNHTELLQYLTERNVPNSILEGVNQAHREWRIRRNPTR